MHSAIRCVVDGQYRVFVKQDNKKCAYHAGPLNYNPVEEWFFHRIKEGRPIPIPNSGQQVSARFNAKI